MTQLRFLTLLWSYRTVTGISDRQIWDYFVNSRDSNFQYPRVDSLQQLEKRKKFYTFLHHYSLIHCQMKFENKIILLYLFLRWLFYKSIFLDVMEMKERTNIVLIGLYYKITQYAALLRPPMEIKRLFFHVKTSYNKTDASVFNLTDI